MANELTALPEFTRRLFKHAYLVLPWFCATSEQHHLHVDDLPQATAWLEALCADRPLFFGPDAAMDKAHGELCRFYDLVTPGDPAAPGNADARQALSRAWRQAYSNRHVLQLRGHETRLMRFFREVYVALKNTHVPELQCMARLIDRDVVCLARSIRPAGGWTPRQAVIEANAEMADLHQQLFGGVDRTPELCKQAHKSKPKTYARYQQLLRTRREAARLRMTEIFDNERWFPIVKSAVLYEHLKEEGLEDFLPCTFRGRVGVQPTGYPLTFYTYGGLELDSPPLHDVVMNPDYGRPEPDKDYKIHPPEDGTFYCESKAVVGDSKTKHYTLAYKRRARKLKYESVHRLADQIDAIRGRLATHLNSDHRDTWVRALMCLLIDRHCARIGNQASTRRADNKTYGITTLQTRKHVRILDDWIILEYRGKHGQPQRHALPRYRTSEGRRYDPVGAAIADRLLELTREKRRFLFTRADRKPYTPQMVNEYFTAAPEPHPEANLPYGGAGSPCTVHNVRNYQATRVFMRLAEKFARRHPEPTYEDVLAGYQGRSRTATRQGRVGAIQVAARLLGNTPAICRKSYIDPQQQLLFFQRWGYRPPDCVIRDLFVQEEHDTYGVARVLRKSRPRRRVKADRGPSR